jgi:hypothetical protein
MNHPENTMGKDDTQDIWVSKKDANGVWGTAQHMGSPFNIHRSNQVLTIFSDGSLLVKGGKTKGTKGFSIVTGNSLREVEVKDFKAMNKGRSMEDQCRQIANILSCISPKGKQSI